MAVVIFTFWPDGIAGAEPEAAGLAAADPLAPALDEPVAEPEALAALEAEAALETEAPEGLALAGAADELGAVEPEDAGAAAEVEGGGVAVAPDPQALRMPARHTRPAPNRFENMPEILLDSGAHSVGARSRLSFAAMPGGWERL